MSNELVEKAKRLGIEISPITAEEINEQVKPVLRKMETVGIRIDCEALNKLDDTLSVKLKKLETEIFNLAGHEFNISSPNQLADILFVEMKLSTDGLKKTKSGISTAAGELRKIAEENKIIPLVLEYRELSKLISTYLKPLPTLVDENDRLHTTYGMETSTGRLTSSEPNLQNIPIRGDYGAEIRGTFIANKGYKLIAADYSQIELRVVACLAKDKSMIESFKNGEDIHTRTAAEIFNVKPSEVTSDMRRKAKAVNFGIVYGQTPYGLSQALGIDPHEAAVYIQNYFEKHPGIKDYINDMIKLAHDAGYVETLFGTRRYLPNINSRMRFIAESEERMAINMPVQGTAAEILKLAMIQLQQKLDSLESSVKGPEKDKKPSTLNSQLSTPRLLLTVHDELVVEAPEKEAEEIAEIVKETMERVVKLCVPIEVSLGIGANWAECK